MARRRAFRFASTSRLTPTKDHTSEGEYYQRRYDEVDKKREYRGLYEESTESQIRMMEKKWIHYCQVVQRDPVLTLTKQAHARRFTNFFHWLCSKYTVRKVSSVITYWHQLSQLYIKYRGRRIKPSVSKEVFEFINSHLAREFGLNDKQADKPLLDVEDFLEVLRCHWVTDTNAFPHERHRVQIATLLLIAAMTGSRPGALLGITYGDMDLFVLRNTKTGEVALTLHLRLIKTKSRQKRQAPKTYTFFVDDYPLFCVISHIIALSCDDRAFQIPGLSPQAIFALQVREGLNCQRIPWHDEMKDKPVFHMPNLPDQRERSYEPLGYHRYQGWVKRLGEETGFVQVLTTYCLRRAAGNAVNDDPKSNEAVRNLVLDHTNSMIFQRNYLSRMIRYDTQAAFRGTASRADMIIASHRMSRMIDPRRPRRPSPEQLRQIREDKAIQELRERSQDLYRQMRHQFQFIYRAVDQPIYKEYQSIKLEIDRIAKEKERALKGQLQADYDATAPMQDILAQLASDKTLLSPIQPSSAPVEFTFEERARIAQAFFPSSLPNAHDQNRHHQIAIIDDLVSLCTRRERRPRRSRKIQDDSSTTDSSDEVSDTEEPADYSEAGAPARIEFPIRCRPFQCLFCIGDTTLPLSERQHLFGMEWSGGVSGTADQVAP